MLPRIYQSNRASRQVWDRGCLKPAMANPKSARLAGVAVMVWPVGVPNGASAACYGARHRLRYALAMPEPKPDDVTFHEVTDSAIYADDRNFYKVEKWTREGWKVDSLHNSLGRAREVFERAIKHRPRITLTLRQRTTVAAG
jgi:hypothetical protein